MYEARDQLAHFILELTKDIEYDTNLEKVKTLATLVSAAAELNNSLK